METKGELIQRATIEKLISELETHVQNRVIDAQIKADARGADPYYKSDMNGYARGLKRMGDELIDKLKSLLR